MTSPEFSRIFQSEKHMKDIYMLMWISLFATWACNLKSIEFVQRVGFKLISLGYESVS